MKRSFLFICLLVLLHLGSKSQLTISGGTIFIGAGASIAVKGNVSSNVDITGNGKIVMNGTTPQDINMNGKNIPNLRIENTNNITLTGDVMVGKNLEFSTGKLILGGFNLLLSDSGFTSGHGNGNFVETNSTGQLRKAVSANLTNFILPTGSGLNYRPVFISTTGNYNNSIVGVQAKNTTHPKKPTRSSDFLNCYWKLNQTGITGVVRATGKYESDFTGAEAELRSITYTGDEWNLSSGNINTSFDTIGALINPGETDLYAMNRFVYLKNKVFLQGAYNTATGLMNDNLRTLASFPVTDPYRTAPYNTYFTHTNNTATETIQTPATVLGTQASSGNNIVDWIFIELRNTNTSPGNTIIQTRSALLQRDGDVVDVDGISPVYFKNVDAGNFTIAIRHRNHLGLSTDPSSTSGTLSEKTTTALVDMSIYTDAQLFGTATVNYTVVNGINMLYAGNVSGNGFVRYQGTNGPGATNVSDRVALLSDLGNNELNTLNTYQRGDVSMNGVTRYQGTNGPGANNVSDRVFILGTVLGNNEIQTRTEALPN
jgi:hypothetical protein